MIFALLIVSAFASIRHMNFERLKIDSSETVIIAIQALRGIRKQTKVINGLMHI